MQPSEQVQTLTGKKLSLNLIMINDFWQNIYSDPNQSPWGGNEAKCTNHFKYKYGALKILDCAVQSGDPGIFTQTLLSGRKIDHGEDIDSICPFFKLQESSSGLARLTREDGRLVEVNAPYVISDMFSTTNTGMEILMNCSELERGASQWKSTNWNYN